MSINTLIPQIINSLPKEQVTLLREISKDPVNDDIFYYTMGRYLTGSQISRMQRMWAI
jgi:hypothetical protein